MPTFPAPSSVKNFFWDISGLFWIFCFHSCVFFAQIENAHKNKLMETQLVSLAWLICMVTTCRWRMLEIFGCVLRALFTVIKASPYHFHWMSKTACVGWVSSDLINTEKGKASCLTSEFWLKRLNSKKVQFSIKLYTYFMVYLSLFFTWIFCRVSVWRWKY